MTADKQVLLEDPCRPGVAAVVRSGPFLFLSSVDGVSDHRTGEIDHAVFGDGPAQARRAYGAVVERLEECGFDGSATVRIEHATSSQDWRLQRMALWPEFFGTPTQAVSQGYQGKMRGRNMITVATVATTGTVEREIIVPGPSPGRASRISRCGPFLFVIGVRGAESLATGAEASQETPDAFAEQVLFSYDNLAHHLAAAGAKLTDSVRFDGFLRDVNRRGKHDERLSMQLSGISGVATSVVGCPLGGSTDLEVSAIAVAPGQPAAARHELAGGAVATAASGLVFTPLMRGDVDADGNLEPHRFGDLTAQLDRALAGVAAAVERGGGDLTSVLRLDVYLPDPYVTDRIDTLLVERFTGEVPAVVRHGAELGPTGLVALTAVAASNRG